MQFAHRDLRSEAGPEPRDAARNTRLKSIVGWGAVVVLSFGLAWVMARGVPSY